MVGLDGVAWHRLLFFWCEEEEEEEEEEEASSQVLFPMLCPHLVFWTVFYKPFAFRSMLGVYVPCSYVSHGGVLEDFFGFWGARGTGNAVSWEMASRTRFCIQRNAWSSVHVMRQSTEFFVYVDTDPELDSPALAGVFNAPVPFFHGPLYLAATGSVFGGGVQDLFQRFLVRQRLHVRRHGFSGRSRHMFPYPALWFNSGYIFMSVSRISTTSYLAVTCSAFAAGVSWTFLGDHFWMFSVSNSCWFNTGYMLLQFTEAFGVSTAENCGVSAVAVHHGRRLLLHGAQADFHGLAVQQTIGIPQFQFLNEVIDVPVVPSRSHARCVQRQVPFCVAHQQGRLHSVVSQRLIPMVLFVQMFIEIPQLLDAVADVPVVRVVQVLTGAVVEETVELPRLHSLRNLSSGAAH